ncbi:MAG: OPT/YSL family transporter, partial [Candidatus Polarisedimenticolia bacterium]
MNEPVEAPPVAGLPENAHRPLRSGETYEPVVPAAAAPPEFTRRALFLGLGMTVLFSAAAAYIALKLGQGIETAIPIAILAVGYSALVRRPSTLLENLQVVALGATAGIVVGGSVFVMPAFFLLDLDQRTGFAQIFLVPFLGATLGVLFLIPFRRYFVADMHGKLPFPEATASTEVLVAGERGGESARVLLAALGGGFALDYLALGFKTWTDNFTSALLPLGDALARKVKAVFTLNPSAAVLGLGFIVGVRYAS